MVDSGRGSGSRALSPAQRAWLFARLAQAERAGLPLENLLSNLEIESSQSVRNALSDFRKRLRDGSGLARAGRLSGLFLDWEARLLEAAETAGQLEASYRHLGRWYEARARHARKLRSGMVFPVLFLLLMIFVSPLRALLTAEISGVQYLLTVFGRLLLLLGGAWLISLAWRRLQADPSDRTRPGLLFSVPGIGSFLQMRDQYQFLFSLALLLEAGVPAITAVRYANDSIAHPELRQRYAGALHFLEDGMTVGQALQHAGILPDGDAAGLIQAGEFSGRLPEMLHHQAAVMEQQLDERMDAIATWLPRIVYLLALLLLLL